jgi:hypothetical protein
VKGNWGHRPIIALLAFTSVQSKLLHLSGGGVMWGGGPSSGLPPANEDDVLAMVRDEGRDFGNTTKNVVGKLASDTR